jgi:uncharacterized protein (TIGR03435 family)
LVREVTEQTGEPLRIRSMKELLLYSAMALALRAQTFDVASIKPNRSEGGMSSIRASTGRITMENVSLKKVTLWAYGIPDDREYALVGPGGLTTEHFDLQANFPADTPPEQVRRMTQALLAERFKLALHIETRQLPIYVLVVAKNGPKIHPVEDGQPRTSGRPGQFEATKIPMQHFADLLARFMHQQVVDETGLAGVFDFTLEWSPDEMKAEAMPPTGGTIAPSIFTALQEQLGLKLEGRKGPVEVLVVDHIEKAPTENQVCDREVMFLSSGSAAARTL